MQAWGFVSNRLFDVLACGTPVISDPVAGMAELFDGAVLEYRGPAELRALVASARRPGGGPGPRRAGPRARAARPHLRPPRPRAARRSRPAQGVRLAP